MRGEVAGEWLDPQRSDPLSWIRDTLARLAALGL
jgi:hypothetical protein